MNKRIALAAGAALIAAVALVTAPGGAAGKPDHGKHGHGATVREGVTRGAQLQGDLRRQPALLREVALHGRRIDDAAARPRTLRSGPGEPGLGTLWYKARPYGDFSLRLQFRDDAPAGARANSGVQVRFPAPKGPVPGCGDTPGDDPWIAIRCGHEVQINDSPDGDPRKTGSIYGFADLDAALGRGRAGGGAWNDLEIRVVGQPYTVTRNGKVINQYVKPSRWSRSRTGPDDPGPSGRGLVGYVGLQAHGSANDVVSFRNIRIRDLSAE